MLLSRQTHKSRQHCARSAPWTEAPAPQPPSLRLAGDPYTQPPASSRPAPPPKGKEIRDFQSCLEEIITRMRSGWPPRGPGSFRTWAPSLSRSWAEKGLESVPQSPRIQNSQRRGLWKSPQEAPRDPSPASSLQEPTQPLRSSGVEGRGGRGLRKPAQSASSRERRRPRRLI